MTNLEHVLLLLMHAHAPAATTAGPAVGTLGPDVELRSDLGFDLIALAELAVAIEDAFGIKVGMTEMDACGTVRDLLKLVAARNT